MSNTDDRIINNQKFYGGQASDEAIGPEASFSYSQALEHRRNPSQLTVLPGPRKISGSIVTDLILNVVQVKNGTRFAIGDAGNIYKISTANVVTLVRTITVGEGGAGTDGLIYRSENDTVYYCTPTQVLTLYPATSATTFSQSTIATSVSIDTAATRSGGAASYTVLTAISEAAANKCSFKPDIEPLIGITVKIPNKGTGNWTLTLHDGLNNVLATSTLANGSITAGQVTFPFAAQVRALVKPNARTYHFHLTSTVADGTVQVTTASDLSTADYTITADRLVKTVNGFHPIAQFLQYLCIGNGNYLSVWEPLTETSPPNNEFERHRLTFPTGYEVTGLAVTDEFLVIACGRYASDGSKDFQDGKLFTWDGVSKTYNQIIDVSAGTPEGIHTHENYPYFFVNGTLCAWPGGKNIINVRTIANTDTTYKDVVDNTKVYPNMMTVKDNLLHCGYPSNTNNTSIEHGVYVWGSLEKNFPSSFNYGYVPSHQNKLNTTGTRKLGCVRNFGDEMYISWRDGANYGLDIVDSLCDPAPVFKFRARRFDASAVYKVKKALRTGIYTDALPSGVTITPVYRIDANAEIVQSEFVMNPGDSERIATIQTGNFKRITYGFDGVCSGTTTPVIYANTLSWNPYMDRRSM